MEKLDFVLWMCLYPMCTAIGDYYSYKRKKMCKESLSVNENAKDVYHVFLLITYVVLAIIIFSN